MILKEKILLVVQNARKLDAKTALITTTIEFELSRPNFDRALKEIELEAKNSDYSIMKTSAPFTNEIIIFSLSMYGINFYFKCKL